MKKCSTCGRNLSEDSFEILPKKGNKYLRSVCRTCRYSTRNKQKSASPEAYMKHLYTQLKSSRRKSKLEWALEFEDVIQLWYEQEGKCALSGMFMTWQKDGSGKKELNISIDRIDPHIGYILGNIQLVTTRVNILKHSLTEDELYWWCKNIVVNKEKFE